MSNANDRDYMAIIFLGFIKLFIGSKIRRTGKSFSFPMSWCLAVSIFQCYNLVFFKRKVGNFQGCEMLVSLRGYFLSDYSLKLTAV